jgi:tetratricopeptide (TPR) repeat protein
MTYWAAYGSSERLANQRDRLQFAEKAHQFLALGPPSFELVNVLIALANGLSALDREDEARPLYERAIEENDRLPPSRRNISLYYLVGETALNAGLALEARRVLETGLRLAKSRGYQAQSAIILHCLSRVESTIGNVEISEALRAEALSLAEKLSDSRLLRLVRQSGVPVVDR